MTVKEVTRLTQLKEGGLALHPRTGPGAGRHLQPVRHTDHQTRNQNREGGTVHRAVNVIAALISNAPDLRRRKSWWDTCNKYWN